MKTIYVREKFVILDKTQDIAPSIYRVFESDTEHEKPRYVKMF